MATLLDDYPIPASLRVQVAPGCDARAWRWYTDWYREHLWRLALAKLENPS